MELFANTNILPLDRQVKIITGRGGMELLQKAFVERGFEMPEPDNVYTIESDFPEQPEKLF